jgi:hypothetical protein
MPDLLVLTDEETAGKLRPIFNEIATVLRDATARSFADLKGDKMKVAAMLILFVAGSNAPKIQILGIASHSKAREDELENWKENLIQAWREAMLLPGVAIELLQISLGPKDVEVWPIMPIGRWSIVKQSTK